MHRSFVRMRMSEGGGVMRRLIWIVVAVAVLGGLGFFAYDRYLGSELREGRELRDALAEELASAGIAFTSIKYDWRKRRVVAQDLVATELPEGVASLNIGKAVYRGAKPEAIRAAFENGKDLEKPQRLITDLALSEVLVNFENGAEFKQASLTLKRVSLGQPAGHDTEKKNDPLLRAADIARRLHVRLLEAKDARFWHPEGQSTYEQKLVRLEDYRAGNFSEFRLEGLSLVVAVVVRASLDEYFIQSVKARPFLDNFDKTAIYSAYKSLGQQIGTAFAELGAEQGEGTGEEGSTGDGNEKDTSPDLATIAETAIVTGNEAAIGFELLIPAAGRIAFEEISTSDRQFVNGLELGGNSKIVALELQFNMLTRILTAGLDFAGVNLASAADDASDEAQAWLAAHSGRPVDGDGPIPVSLQSDEEGVRTEEPESGEEKPDRADTGEGVTPPDAGTAGMGDEPEEPEAEGGISKEDDEQIPMGPRDGEVEQGPAAPVPEVWGNKIKPPEAPPQMDNKKIAEFIRKLGFDNLRIDSESVSRFDEENKVYEISKFVFDMRKFWGLEFDLRLSGVGAVEEVGDLPVGGFWQGPKAAAVGDRFMKEGHFDGLSFTYRDKGFIKRLLSLIAEERGTTPEELASAAMNGLFSPEKGGPILNADGLQEAMKAFLLSPDVFAIHFRPEGPVPFRAFQTMNEEKTPLPRMVDRLGMVLTFNEKSFENFKKTAPISSDNEGEQD